MRPLRGRGAEARGRGARAGARGGVRAAHAPLLGLTAERARFAGATDAAREVLATAAAAGYRDGERTLLELIDARRAVLENAERRLALDLAVRLAEVRLRGATGSP